MNGDLDGPFGHSQLGPELGIRRGCVLPQERGLQPLEGRPFVVAVDFAFKSIEDMLEQRQGYSVGCAKRTDFGRIKTIGAFDAPCTRKPLSSASRVCLRWPRVRRGRRE
jgi:hypothetical protein